MILRAVKIALAAAAGLLLLIVGVDNILDYDTNFEAVRHIMSMDTVPGAAFAGRAITSPALHHAFYWLIIAAELAGAVLTLLGCERMTQALRGPPSAFVSAKELAILGLGLGLGLYLFGFMGVGGEWFEMWRSQQWNMQEAAFRFIGSIGVVLILVALPE